MYDNNSFHINSAEGSHLVNKLCEAVDCSEEATEQVEISAGKHGFINLFVCNNCIPKFLGGNTNSDFRQVNHE